MMPYQNEEFLGALNALYWPAMRYALGRMTYVVSDVCEVLKSNAPYIKPDIRNKMINEIKEAIEKDEAGHKIDIIRWQEVIDAFKEAEKEDE